MSPTEKIQSWFSSHSQSIRSNKKVAYHTGLVFASTIVVNLLGIAAKTIQTRTLTPEEYGLYAFFTSLTSITVVFFHVGIFPTLEFMLASNNNKEKERELFGAGIVLTVFISLLFSLFLFLISFFIDDIFKIEFGTVLRLVVPLCIVLPFRSLLSFMAIGANKTLYAAWLDMLAQFLFCALLAWFFFYSDLSLLKIIYLSLATGLMALIVILFFFKPAFKNVGRHIQAIKAQNKEYGFHMYLAFILSEISYRADEFLIPLFLSTTLLGYYSLAHMICSPMVMLSLSAGAVLFKRLANDKLIHPKIFSFNYAWIALSLTVLFLLADKVVILFFGNDFSEVAKYIMPLSILYVFKTLQQPYAFLTAKGMGKEIKNITLVESITSVAANLICIPLWGVPGAIGAGVFARFVGYLSRRYYYQKYLAVNNL